MTRGRPQPPDHVGRLRDPVPPREDRPDRDHAAGPAGARRRLDHRDRGGGEDPPRRARAHAAGGRHRLLRAARARARSSRSRSTARAGSGSGRRIRVRVGAPIEPVGRATREAVDALTAADVRCAPAAGRRLPGPARAGPFRPVADRAVQRLAGGCAARARARATAPAPRSPIEARQGRRERPRAHPVPRPTCRGPTPGCGILLRTTERPGDPVGATGLSADTTEYRARLAEQTDAQIDAWAAEMMRDVAIRRGVVRVVEDFCRAARLNELEFERVFASGGGSPATVGHDAQGRLMVPPCRLWALVPGIRSQVAGRPRPADRVPRGQLPRAGLRLTSAARGLRGHRSRRRRVRRSRAAPSRRSVLRGAR